jgi:hypothetical protein
VVRYLTLTGLCLLVGLVLTVPGPALAGGKRHPRLHVALHELRMARAELKAAGHNFGGHKAEAVKAIDAALGEIEAGLRAIGEDTEGQAPPAEALKKYKSFPHIHHAVDALRDGREALENAKTNFGGHRAAAIREVNHALEELRLAVKFAKG